MALEEVEEVPAIPSVSGWVAKFSGIPLKELLYDSTAIVKAQTEAQRAVGYDALFAYIDPLYVPEAFGCPLLLRSSGADVSPLEINNKEDVNLLPLENLKAMIESARGLSS
jgi:uroporphyrinogen-III decarboxylase